MEDCLFCSIIKGDIPGTKIYEDEQVYAFLDINPVAPVHILVAPKAHIANLAEIDSENSGVVAAIFEAIAKIASDQGLENGYRIVSNVGVHGCQSVDHLHFHLIGGKQLEMRMC